MKHRILSSAFVVLLAGIFFLSTPSSVQANKCGINVGPYYGEAEQVRALTNEGGWIVALGTNGDCGKFQDGIFGKGLNVALRGYNNGRPFTDQEAAAWTATLGQLDTKGQKVYFMPWNEPNHTNEGGGDNAALESYNYTALLKQHLNEAGLLNSKVVLLSPMVNKLHPNYPSWFDNVPGGRDAYYGLTSGSSINEYDQALSQNNYRACVANSPYDNNCRYGELNLPNEKFALESGVTGTGGGGYLHYRDDELIEMLTTSWTKAWRDDGSFRMFAIFSYDPHVPGDWDLYTAPQVTNFYRSTCTPGSVDMMSVAQEDIMAEGSAFQTWLANNSHDLSKCDEGCGYAPAAKQDLCTGVNRSEDDSATTKFYIAPIEGIDVSATAVRDGLVRQGYEAYCAMPKQAVSEDYSGEIEAFWNTGGDRTFDLNPVFMIDLAQAQYPLLRDSDRKGQLKADFESFWSIQDGGGPDYSTNELSSAPIESLLSEEQRCVQGVNNLFAQKEMCEKLSDPSTCALYPVSINNTSFTVETLINTYQSKAGNKTPQEMCRSIMQKMDSKNPSNQSTRLFTGLTNIPLSVEKAYRLAFLVIKITNVQERKPLFSFFAFNAKPRDQVLVVAFKIPDVITDKPIKGFLDSSAYPSFSDGAMLTRDSLLTTKQTEVRIETEQTRRNNLIGKLAEVEEQSESSEIYCIEKNNAGGSESCKDPVVKALTDLVNAQSGDKLSCPGEDKIDDAYTILEPTSLGGLTTSPVFSPELGGELLSNIFNSLGGATGIDTSKQTFTSEIFVSNNTKHQSGDGGIEVGMYFVYPVGYELADIESILKNSFLTKDQITLLESDKHFNERFEMLGDKKTLTENSASSDFLSDLEPRCFTDDQGNHQCFGIKLDFIAKPLQVLGARLGYYMRAIQRTLAKETSNVQEYLASCETVEEFLLDRCAGVGQKEPQSSITYCGMKELSITNSSTSQFTVCKTNAPATDCDAIAPGSDSYFLDRSSSYSLQIATRILDGATLITTGSVVTMNPGQGYEEGDSMARCGKSPENLGTATQIWYLPADVPESEVRSAQTWIDKGSKLTPITGTNEWTNVVINLQVKPGYYMLPSETFGCLSRVVSWAGRDGQESQERFILGSSVIPVGIGSKGRDSYCAKATYNSNMPGGPGGDFYKNESFGCSINEPSTDEPGFNLKLNNSCGGLNSSFEDISLWTDLLKLEVKVPGLAMYEKMFGRKFVIPGGEGSCDSLFPNTIREVPCDQVSNNDVGTIANFGKEINFDIEYWDGDMTNFKLPSQELWSAIKDAEARHSCDPLLVLAVAHSESRTFTNHTIPNKEASALGVFQFTPGSWNIWKTYQPAAVSMIAPQQKCAQGLSQPPTFTESVKNSLDFSSPTNIKAAADSACRLIMWTGMQDHPYEKKSFIRAFAIEGENSYKQVWNIYAKKQADYVWRLWMKLREETGKDAVAPPINYPYPCDTPA